MKNLDLNSYGVQEMDAKVMVEIDGGAPAGIIMDKDARDWYIGFIKGFFGIK